MGVSKIVLNGVTQMDITDTTAVASDVAQGKYFYGSDGEKIEGVATGFGAVTQDEDGYIVLPTTGGDSSNIIEMHNVYGSTTKWNSPEVDNTFADGGYLEVEVDLSQTQAPSYLNIISIGAKTTIGAWRTTTATHIYHNRSGSAESYNNSIAIAQNGTTINTPTIDTSMPHTIKIDKDYIYVDDVAIVALQSGVASQDKLMFGSTEGNARFTGKYKSIIYR